MKIGIIGAMEEEISILKDMIEFSEIQKINHQDYIVGTIDSHSIIMVKSGIGKVNATMTVMQLKYHFDIDIVINTGSAGGIDPMASIGDIIIANELIYHDVDVTNFGYQIGQMAGMPASYYPNSDWMFACQSAARTIGVEPILGLVVSGDQFVNDHQKIHEIRYNFPLAKACEMESTAIAQTCYQLDIPYLIIRAISDNADDEATMTFDEFIKMAGDLAAKLVYQTILNYKTN